MPSFSKILSWQSKKFKEDEKHEDLDIFSTNCPTLLRHTQRSSVDHTTQPEAGCLCLSIDYKKVVTKLVSKVCPAAAAIINVAASSPCEEAEWSWTDPAPQQTVAITEATAFDVVALPKKYTQMVWTKHGSIFDDSVVDIMADIIEKAGRKATVAGMRTLTYDMEDPDPEEEALSMVYYMERLFAKISTFTSPLEFLQASILQNERFNDFCVVKSCFEGFVENLDKLRKHYGWGAWMPKPVFRFLKDIRNGTAHNAGRRASYIKYLVRLYWVCQPGYEMATIIYPLFIATVKSNLGISNPAFGDATRERLASNFVRQAQADMENLSGYLRMNTNNISDREMWLDSIGRSFHAGKQRSFDAIDLLGEKEAWMSGIGRSLYEEWHEVTITDMKSGSTTSEDSSEDTSEDDSDWDIVESADTPAAHDSIW